MLHSSLCILLLITLWDVQMVSILLPILAVSHVMLPFLMIVLTVILVTVSIVQIHHLSMEIPVLLVLNIFLTVLSVIVQHVWIAHLRIF